MPVEQYQATLSDGRTVIVESDHPPTEQEILSSLGGGSGGTLGGTSGDVPRGAGVHPPSAQRDWIDTAASWIPTAAGAAGGILGGTAGFFGGGVGAAPGAALGAGAGGALGKALEKGIQEYRHPDEQNLLSLDTLKDIGMEGGIQGGMELVGGALTRGAAKVGTSMYRKMLRPAVSERLAPRAAEIVQTGIKENINPYNLAQVEGLEPRISGINAEVEAMGRGTRGTVMPSATAGRVSRNIDKYAFAGADPADRAAARSVPSQFVADNTVDFGAHGGVPRPVEIPQNFDDIMRSRRSTGASAGNKNFGVTRGAETETRKELYHELGNDLTTLNPATRPKMDLERKLIDLKDASMTAYNRGANSQWLSLRHLAPLGVGVGAGAVMGPQSGMGVGAGALALSNPRVITRAALMAARSNPHGFWTQIPRLLAGGYHALTVGDQSSGH